MKLRLERVTSRARLFFLERLVTDHGVDLLTSVSTTLVNSATEFRECVNWMVLRSPLVGCSFRRDVRVAQLRRRSEALRC